MIFQPYSWYTFLPRRVLCVSGKLGCGGSLKSKHWESPLWKNTLSILYGKDRKETIKSFSLVLWKCGLHIWLNIIMILLESMIKNTTTKEPKTTNLGQSQVSSLQRSNPKLESLITFANKGKVDGYTYKNKTKTKTTAIKRKGGAQFL